MAATNGAAPLPCRDGDDQGAGRHDGLDREGFVAGDLYPREPDHPVYAEAMPTGRPASLDTSTPRPAPEPTSQPVTPSRKPGGHWPWDSTYMDYVQHRGGQVLLYSEYQSPGEPRSAAASERCSGSKYDLADHSYDTRSLDDLALNGRGRAAKTLSSSIKQVPGPQHVFTPPNSQDYLSLPQITPSLAVAPSSSPKPYEQPLDPQFQVVAKPKRFFSIGRIFKVVWFEPLGQQNSTTSSELDWSTACPPFHEQSPYAKFRWFVVVRKRLHHSLCLSITTFGGKTATKTSRGRSKDFVVLYPHTIEEPPEPFPEEGIARQPIAVIIEECEQLLAPTARLDCARIYTVEDNVKVMKIGRVHPESLEDLESYYQESVS